MKILKQDRIDNKVTLEVEIPSSDFARAMEEELADASKEIKVPGFRPGKAPKNIVESYLNKDVLKERAVRRVFSYNYSEIIRESKIEPVDYPELNIKSEPVDENPLVLEIKVEVYPEVKVGNYKGVKAEKISSKVEDKEINDYLNQLRENHAEFIDIGDNDIAAGNIVEVDIVASVGDRAVLELTKTRYGTIVGDDKYELVPGFGDQLNGVKINQEKNFSLKLPDDFANKDFAGKDCSFEITVKRAVNKKLPEIDDDFAKKLGDFDTVAKLKEETRKMLEDHKKADADADVKNKIVDIVSDESTVIMPNALIEKEVEIMIDEFKKSLENSNISLEDYLSATKKDINSMKEEIKGSAEKRAKSKVVLRAIAEKEKIDVTDPEINEEVNSLAASIGRDSGAFHQELGQSGRDYIKDYLIRRKALDHLVASAKIKVKGE